MALGPFSPPSSEGVVVASTANLAARRATRGSTEAVGKTQPRRGFLARR